MPTNYTLIVEKNYASAIWLRLSVPQCSLDSSGATQVTISANGAVIPITKYSQYDYVLQLKPGMNFLVVSGLRNPVESCLFASQRLSFEFRTYEDEKMLYGVDELVTGLEPSLSCESPCKTCESNDKTRCKSCDSNLLLKRDQAACVSPTQCG